MEHLQTALETRRPQSTHQVQLPYAIVLRDGQRLQRAVEGAPGARDQPLLHQQLQVLRPHPRHLVHADQRALVGVVQAPQLRVRDLQAPARQPPLAQVRRPELRGVTEEIVGGQDLMPPTAGGGILLDLCPSGRCFAQQHSQMPIRTSSSQLFADGAMPMVRNCSALCSCRGAPSAPAHTARSAAAPRCPGAPRCSGTTS